jgi:hypothetical protein
MGAMPCGSGTFTQSDSQTACSEPGSLLDTWHPMPGGPVGVERHCDAVTFASGEWQAWCTLGELYYWVKFSGLHTTGAYPSACPGGNWLTLSSANICSEATSGGNCGGKFDPNGADMTQTSSTDTVIERLVPLPVHTTPASAFLMAYHEVETCPVGGPSTPGPSVAVGAATITWMHP